MQKQSEQIKLQFWGVRGSIPTPGPQTARYGGNTPCVSIFFPDDSIFLLDAGTGIRQFGIFYQNHRPKKSLHIFISHFHWDHIQGLPFFHLLRNPEYHITIYGCDEPDNHLANIISRQMESTYFPVEFEDLAARIDFEPLTEGKYLVENVMVESFFVNHPGYALGYAFLYDQKKVVYISDNEPFPDKSPNILFTHTNRPDINIEDIFENYHENKLGLLVKKLQDADVLIHDAQFFPAEYRNHQLWGHSPFTFPIELAMRAGVSHLFLFHHDPNHDDDILDRLYLEAVEYGNSIGYKGIIHIAKEMEQFLL